MIQRIQTIYLLLTALSAGVLQFWLPLWYTVEGAAVFALSQIWILVAFIGVALLALIALFTFKNRQHQFVLNRLNMLLNLFLLGSFVFRTLKLSGETAVSEKGIGLLIPVFSIVLLVLANKAIRKDEELVKSVDRLR